MTTDAPIKKIYDVPIVFPEQPKRLPAPDVRRFVPVQPIKKPEKVPVRRER